MLQNVTFTQQMIDCLASCCPRCAEAMGWLCQLPFQMYWFISVRKWARAVLLLVLLLLYCEFLHYFVVLLQCSWPQLANSGVSQQLGLGKEHKPLKVMVIADLHLLGWREGHWFDKVRREWQMERSFKTSVLLYNPDVVFVLGDLLDEGQWCSDFEFKYHEERFKSMFSVSSKTDMHVVVGNHDIGFHYVMNRHKHHRFESAFNSPSVRMLRIRDNIFVLVNSMTLEGDGCSLCSEAVGKLRGISQHLECIENPLKSQSHYNKCHHYEQFKYTKPILLQHFPMYRPSDADCDTPDAAPPGVKNIPFKLKVDCLSKEASRQLLDWISPRFIISAHTHHGCYRVHDNNIPEWTVASYSWRNKNNPTFLLMTVGNEDYAVKRCFLPSEFTVIMMYIIGVFTVLLLLIFPRRVVKFSSGDKAH
ncbi:metallophosphoesterase 1-like [Gigantopelta aegis]|uniref:metallophosphoesterase 1-like n=1 Tax=Gigantopelta aegis TaxID=1735272 RepID=UPI001B888EEC|nr:metallophosphoesterase 1-like [Gigantopelta aegis]